MNLIWINNAQYLGDYRILLTFNNGEQRVFDGSEYVNTHKSFAALKDTANFKNFELDGWTISWRNNSLDIAPEYLFENGIKN